MLESTMRKIRTTRDRHCVRCVSITCLAVSLCANAAAARSAWIDTEALRTADTASPRDTLRRFLPDSRQTAEDLTNDRRDENTYRPFRRARQILKYTATQESGTWLFRGRRVALQQELLARAQLPPPQMITDDPEFADDAITQKTNYTMDHSITGIQIEEIRSGRWQT